LKSILEKPIVGSDIIRNNSAVQTTIGVSRVGFDIY
jgi:hypothetical protein